MDFPLSERIEAEVRRLMASHSRIPERGWSTKSERESLQRRIDALLDELAELRLLDEYEPEMAS